MALFTFPAFSIKPVPRKIDWEKSSGCDACEIYIQHREEQDEPFIFDNDQQIPYKSVVEKRKRRRRSAFENNYYNNENCWDDPKYSVWQKWTKDFWTDQEYYEWEEMAREQGACVDNQTGICECREVIRETFKYPEPTENTNIIKTPKPNSNSNPNPRLTKGNKFFGSFWSKILVATIAIGIFLIAVYFIVKSSDKDMENAKGRDFRFKSAMPYVK